jgi:NitT/TauT family transport system substrate-binding protein
MKRLLIVLSLLLLIVAPAAAQGDLTEINVFMPFVPNIQFAPVYVAIDNGYFAGAGLDVTLEYGSEPDGVELIATGEMDYGFISGEQVILARANERPVSYVYEWYQRNPIAVVAPEGVTEPGDLAGLNVGVPGRFGATYISLTALLATADLTEDDINLEEIGFNAPEVVCVGGVDAAAVYVNNEPLQIESRIAANDCDAVERVNTIPVADYADLVSNGIVTGTNKINDNPDEVRAFVAAFELALRDVLANPIEAYLLSEAYIEGLPLETPGAFQNEAYAVTNDLTDDATPEEIAARREQALATVREQVTPAEQAQLDVLAATLDLWTAEEQLGLTDERSWELTQDTLLGLGFIEEIVDLSDAFTNAFVPGIVAGEGE